ncbi:MAG: PAS domain S-box protein [Gemmatimonadota bacterium]|nr:PAS domain S-box protein [Gemmatimonadota bacterium]
MNSDHQPMPERRAHHDAEVLLASEHRYRALVEWMPEPFVVHRDGKILFANPAALSLFRAAVPDDLVGRSILDLTHQSSHAFAAERARELAVRGGRTPPGEMRIIRLDGTELDVEVQGGLIIFDGAPANHVSIRDVTARKAAELQLRESEARYRGLVETSHDLIWRVDREGRYTFLNQAWERTHGYRVAEKLGQPFAKFVRPDLVARDVASFGDVLHGGSLIGHQTVHLSKSGEEIELVFNAGPLLDATGAVVGAQGTASDVTARNTAERALRASEARYRAIAQSANDAIITADDRGVIVGWNRGAERIFGWPEADVLGQSVTCLMPEAMRLQHAASVARMADGAVPSLVGRALKLRAIRRSGIEFPVDLSLSRWETPEGWFLTAIVRDVSDRERAEAVLRLEGAALEAAANAIVITDRQGVIEWVNTAFTVVSGYEKWEAIGQTPGALLQSGRTDAGVYARMWQTIRAGQVWHGEIVNRRKDGTLFTEDMTITPLRDASGQITHFIAVKQDITQRRMLEDQFRQSQKMESVGRLAGGVAHDFNNMLSVILGHAELAMAQMDEGHPLHADLLEIHTAAPRSAELTRRLLAFARKQAVVPAVLDVNEVVASSLRMLQRLIGEDITLDWRPDAALWAIRMDPSQLDQILANLCVNARDAIDGVGTLTITTANCVLDEAYCATRTDASPGDYVRIAVRDTGCGMSATVIGHLFEPFFTTKQEGQGTGLGLATVYGAVRQNEGFITVESEPGRGTVFDIYLPRHLGSDQPGTTATADEAGAQGHETILLVEDEPAILHLAERALATHGYRVLCAEHPDRALQLAADHSGTIDLLLTDVIMPRLSGNDLAVMLAAVRPQMKLLFMSGYSAGTLAAHGIQEEGRHFLAKPFRLDQLLATVRAVLDEE